jgi:hypothetical protein
MFGFPCTDLRFSHSTYLAGLALVCRWLFLAVIGWESIHQELTILQYHLS